VQPTSLQIKQSRRRAKTVQLARSHQQEAPAASLVALAELVARVIHARAECFVLAVTTMRQRVTSVQKDGISPTMNKEAASLAFQVNFKTRQERKNV
jgi:hypothetical protein